MLRGMLHPRRRTLVPMSSNLEEWRPIQDIRTPCPICKLANVAGIAIKCRSTTTMFGWGPFLDDEGRKHEHNPNAIERHLTCARGHQWTVPDPQQCWCGWQTQLVAKTG